MYKLSKNNIKNFIGIDHLGVTLMVLLLGWLFAIASINLTVFNPIKKSLLPIYIMKFKEVME